MRLADQEKPEECPHCHKMVDPYNKNVHLACCEAFMQFPPAPILLEETRIE